MFKKSKILICGFLLLFYFSFLSAQNWKPINSNWKYNYQLTGANYITNTIWIDSAKISGGDSIFYLNRIVIKCDTCTKAIGGPNPCDSCYALKNQPQFLQRKMIKFSNENYFTDTGKFTLQPLANVNDTWIFDSLKNISAQVVDNSLQVIFGNSDSVKTILLSSGDIIRISKSFGILEFPNGNSQNSKYKLVGIEGPNLGEQVPNFWDIFNFNVGDIFEYQSTIFDGTGPMPYCNEILKYSITYKAINNDSLIYRFQGHRKYGCWGPPWGPWPNSFIDYSIIDKQVYFIDSTNQAANKYNNQLIQFIKDWSPDTTFNFLNVYKDTDNIITKSFGNDGIMGSFSNYVLLDSTSDILNSGSCPHIETYKKGLGLTHLIFDGCFEYRSDKFLTAYKLGNDTTGIFTPDSLLVNGIEEKTFENKIKIFPNPFTTTATIKISPEIKLQNAEIKIYDVLGRVVFQSEIKNPQSEIHKGNLPNGIYFYQLKNKNEILANGKMVVND